MSDHRYLCELYGLEPSRSHELVDVILEGDERELRDGEDRLSLEAGRLVHLILLTPDSPARVVGVEFNKVLDEPIDFSEFNELRGKSRDDPGQWFVDKGYTVRSRKTGGHWFQVAFGRGNLVRSEMAEYLRNHARLEFDEAMLDDGRRQAFGGV